MASEWIKWTKGLHRKKEVLGIAEALGVPPVHAAGLCMVFWEWLDDNVSEKDVDEDGNAHVTLGPLQLQFLDRLVMADGFAAALAAVGWLQPRNGSLVVPNFTRHNGQTGKTRAITAERVARHRTRRQECNASVTLAPLQKRYQKRKEKNREENLIPSACAEGSSEPNAVRSEPPPSESPPTESRGPPSDRDRCLLEYPCVGRTPIWRLTADKLEQWRALYPNIDVELELRKALAWVQAHEKRRKTARGMERFLVGWLNRAVDHSPNLGGPQHEGSRHVVCGKHVTRYFDRLERPIRYFQPDGASKPGSDSPDLPADRAAWGQDSNNPP